jgi:hypothetical protein
MIIYYGRSEVLYAPEKLLPAWNDDIYVCVKCGHILKAYDEFGMVSNAKIQGKSDFRNLENRIIL